QLLDAVGVDVEAHGRVLTAEGGGQRQADIAQPDHGDADVVAFGKRSGHLSGRLVKEGAHSRHGRCWPDAHGARHGRTGIAAACGQRARGAIVTDNRPLAFPGPVACASSSSAVPATSAAIPASSSPRADMSWSSPTTWATAPPMSWIGCSGSPAGRWTSAAW